jgi:trimeric autotransporter adhesin
MITRLLALGVAAALAAGQAQAESFVYRGELHDAGAPAEGVYQLRLSLFGIERAALPIGGPLELLDVQVNDGRFVAEVDFGTLPAGATDAWVEVAVKTPGDAGYVPLPGRTRVQAKASLCPESWALAGNPFTNAAVSFVGTTDDQPLVLRANNQVGLRILPALYVPNVIGGHANNNIEAGVYGATIGGGGGQFPNLINATYGTVGGGQDNWVLGYEGTVGGGAENVARERAFVGGGLVNSASGTGSAVAGGHHNASSGDWSAVVGGSSNVAVGVNSHIGGGQSNRALSSLSTVAGGMQNMAAGDASVVAGGEANCAGGIVSWAGGLRAKVRPAADPGYGACTGLPSYPGGSGDGGTFIWSDTQPSDFVSSGSNQFMVRATGGVAINAVPFNDQVELTVVADNNGANYANLLLRQRDFQAGVLVSVGEATGVAANNAALYVDQLNNVGGQVRRMTVAGNGDFSVTANAYKPGGGSWSVLSDARLKTDVQPLEGALSKLLALHGVRFRYAEPDPASRPAGEHAGFVAQQVAEVFPHWVGQDADGHLTVGTQGFEALAVEALRELSERNALLQDELDALRRQQAAEIAELRAALADMRAPATEAVAAGGR